MNLQPRPNRKVGLTLGDYCKVGKQLGCTVADIRTVDAVESGGSGYFSDGRVKILFEGHFFYRLLRAYPNALAKIRAEAPSICYPKWTKQYYFGGIKEYQRLGKAIALCEKYNVPIKIALQSASWGRYQVMGEFIHKHWKNIELAVDEFFQDELAHLQSFANYIEVTGLSDELRGHKWASFAFGYNGSGYKRNNYDVKLANAYRKFAPIKVDCNKLLAENPRMRDVMPVALPETTSLNEQDYTDGETGIQHEEQIDVPEVEIISNQIEDYSKSEKSDIPPSDSAKTVEEVAPKEFDAFIPQMNTEKSWLKRVGAAILGLWSSYISLFNLLPEPLNVIVGVGLLVLTVIVVVGGIVMFVKYRSQIIAYVTKMNSDRADKTKDSPILKVQ